MGSRAFEELNSITCDFTLLTMFSRFNGGRDLMVGRWACNPEVPGSNPPLCHYMDLSSVAPNSTPLRFVNSQQLELLTCYVQFVSYLFVTRI